MYEATICFQASSSSYKPEEPHIRIEITTEVFQSMDREKGIAESELQTLIHDIVRLINKRGLTARSDIDSLRICEDGSVSDV